MCYHLLFKINGITASDHLMGLLRSFLESAVVQLCASLLTAGFLVVLIGILQWSHFRHFFHL